MGKTAFVTGGTGFVGSHLAQVLLEHGYSEVRCLVRTRLKWLENIPVVPVRGILSDQALIADAVRDADFVYHLGGVTRARTYADLEAGNVTATQHLLDTIMAANPGIAKVLITSTLAAVGPAPDGRADESTSLRPVSRYGRSKAAMEAVVRDYASALPIVVVRPPSVYGPRDRDVFTFFKAVQQGFCPVLRGDSGITLVHARDLARGMKEAAEAEATRGETYFIGNDEDVSWASLRRAVMAALGVRAITVPVPRMLVMPAAYLAEGLGKLLGQYPPFNLDKGRELLYTAKRCSSAKAAKDFGYRPRIPLAEGLSHTIAWYQAQGWLRRAA